MSAGVLEVSGCSRSNRHRRFHAWNVLESSLKFASSFTFLICRGSRFRAVLVLATPNQTSRRKLKRLVCTSVRGNQTNSRFSQSLTATSQRPKSDSRCIPSSYWDTMVLSALTSYCTKDNHQRTHWFASRWVSLNLNWSLTQLQGKEWFCAHSQTWISCPRLFIPFPFLIIIFHDTVFSSSSLPISVPIFFPILSQ